MVPTVQTVQVFWENGTAQSSCLLVQRSSLLPSLSTMRDTGAGLFRSHVFLGIHHLIGAVNVNLTGLQTNLCADALNAYTASLFCLNPNLILSFLPDVHTEAVQAALAKHKERKMAVPMPSKRRSLVVQTSMDAYTPPGEHFSLCIL